jgi:hypothetical protein
MVILSGSEEKNKCRRFDSMRTLAFCISLVMVFALSGCKPKVVELKKFPVDTMEGVITQSGVEIDKNVSSDGNGSLKINATTPTVIHLFETGDIDAEDARLLYQAKVRTEGLEGQVFLEMWCHIPGKGDFFSRNLQSPLTGTMNWTSVEALFFLKKGENPDNVKLNLLINGKGTVWIDDIRLMKGPLK